MKQAELLTEPGIIPAFRIEEIFDISDYTHTLHTKQAQMFTSSILFLLQSTDVRAIMSSMRDNTRFLEPQQPLDGSTWMAQLPMVDISQL